MKPWFRFWAPFRLQGLALFALLHAFLSISAQPVEAFSISGRVTNSAGSPVSGVRIESTGDIEDDVFTNSNGVYTLTGAANGTYVITPDKNDVTFTPASHTVTVNNLNVTGVNFVASGNGAATTFKISGRVVNAAGAGIAGVRTRSTGDIEDDILTNLNGEYTLTGAANGTYTVTPDKDDLTFTPASRTVTVNNANVAGVSFIGSGPGAQTFRISGRVVNTAGVGVSGVRIKGTGDIEDGIFTNSNGDYVLTGAANGTYTITPDKDDVAFTPSTRTVTVNNANVSGVNFVASGSTTGGTFTISGRVINAAGVGIPGVKIESTGEVRDGIFTNSNGVYTLTGAAPGTYTITPDKDDVTFTPATRTVTVSTANLTGVNFTGNGAGAVALTISGRVVNKSGIGVAGVRIESTGEIEDGVLTNANGFYTLRGAEAGNYVITPDKDGVVFNPLARTVTVGSTNVSGINFVAQGGGAGQGTLTISGRVVNGSGVGVAGVRIESTGEVNDGVLTNTNGFYTLTGVAPGNYIITPDKTDTSFTPATRTVTVGSVHLTGVNFVAVPGAVTGSFRITGRITNSAGLGVPGVRIESSGAIADGVLTNSNGVFTLVGVPNGTYVITPDKDGVVFSPLARSVTVNGANVSGINFNALGGNAGFGAYTISGRVTNSAGQPIAGVRIESSGEVVDGVFTDANGVYALTRVAPGFYVVTPDLDHADFTPERANVNVTTGNVINVNFVVTQR